VLSDANEFGLAPDLAVVDDAAYDDVGLDELVASLPPDHAQPFLVVVDREAVTDPARSVLVVDLLTGEPPFRCLPRAVAEMWANLSISNMDLSEFAAAVDAAGVFRGRWSYPPEPAIDVAETSSRAMSASLIARRDVVLDLECCERFRPIHRFHAALLDGMTTLTQGGDGLGPVTSDWTLAELDPAGSVDVVCPRCGRDATVRAPDLIAFVERYGSGSPGSTTRILMGFSPFLDGLRTG
jgi:hypothetical protein